MKRCSNAIEEAEAYAEDPICLTDAASPWHSDVSLAVDRDVPAAKMERLSGTFLTKVFEGPYRDAGKWVKEMQDYVHAKGKDAGKIYFYYSACPKCAKKLGKNYVVLLGRVN